MTPSALSGLDLLATAVILVDDSDVLRHMNPAAENLLELSSSAVIGQGLADVFADHDLLAAALQYARRNNCSFSEHGLAIAVSGRPRLHLTCTVTPIARPACTAVLMVTRAFGGTRQPLTTPRIGALS